MAIVPCRECGARLTVNRTGPDRWVTHFGQEAKLLCREIRTRAEAGETGLSLTDCRAAFGSIEEAFGAGRV